MHLVQCFGHGAQVLDDVADAKTRLVTMATFTDELFQRAAFEKLHLKAEIALGVGQLLIYVRDIGAMDGRQRLHFIMEALEPFFVV